MELNSAALIAAKTLLGITDSSQDATLVILGTLVESEAVRRTNNDDVVFDTELIARMLQYRYTTNASGNIASQSYGGVSESYSTDLPDDIKPLLLGYNRIKRL